VINTTNFPTTARKTSATNANPRGSISGKTLPEGPSTSKPTASHTSRAVTKSNQHTATVLSNIANTSSPHNPQSEQSDSKSTQSGALYAGVGAAISFLSILAAIVLVLVVSRRRKTKAFSTITPGSNFNNVSVDKSFFGSKGCGSVQESAVYLEPNATTNGHPEFGKDGYLKSQFTNKGEKSRVESGNPRWNRMEEKSMMPSQTVVFGNAEYEVPAGSKDDQQVENLDYLTI
jgi:hypothetical protein